jgi:three-Cys-motif partner protein
MGAPKIDEIGRWSEVKLDIVKRYAVAYSQILANQKGLSYAYIDAFAGTGYHASKKTGEMIPGSPLNALWVQPPFPEFHLIDLDGDKIEGLRRMLGARRDVHLYHGDCNKILLEEVFPRVRFEDFKRGLCLLDPYKLTLEWKVIQEAGSMGSLDIFLNFPIHDINRTVLHRNPERVSEYNISRMNSYWGDDSWKSIAYEPAEPDLFGHVDIEKVSNQKFAAAFRDRLHKVAGFKRVPKPLPMLNSKGSVVYYLFFASQKDTAENIVNHIFEKFGEGSA